MHGNHTTRVGEGSALIPACISVTSASTLTRDGVRGDPLGPDTVMQEQPSSPPESYDFGGSAGRCLPCGTAPPHVHRTRRRGGKAIKFLCSRLSGLGIASLARGAGETVTSITATATAPKKASGPPAASIPRKGRAKKPSQNPGEAVVVMMGGVTTQMTP